MKVSKMRGAAILVIFLLIMPLVLSQTDNQTGNQTTNQSTNSSNASNSESLQDTLGKAKDAVNIIKDKESREEYLKSAWADVLINTKAGKMLKDIDNGLTFLNPVFNIVLGLKFTLSWLFILSVVMWIILLRAGVNLTSLLLRLYLNKSFKYMRLIISVIWIVLISSIRIPKYLADLIINTVAVVPGILLQILVLILILVAMIIPLRLIKFIKKKVQKAIKREDEKEMKKEVEHQKKVIERIEAKEDIEDLDTEL